MNPNPHIQAYDFTGQSFAITGGAGVLGQALTRGLLECGADVAILDRSLEKAQKAVDSFGSQPGRVIPVQCDVLNVDAIRAAVDQTLEVFGKIDGLINAAGGNQPAATTGVDKSFFDLSPDALRWVFDLNLIGTILPSQIIGRQMAERKQGVILNISSMNAFRPLTRIPAYSAAKAGVSNFTQWLAVHMAQEYSPQIRVNAIAPGFVLHSDVVTPQKWDQLVEKIPLKRAASLNEVTSALEFLVKNEYVTGQTIVVDGGYSLV